MLVRELEDDDFFHTRLRLAEARRNRRPGQRPSRPVEPQAPKPKRRPETVTEAADAWLAVVQVDHGAKLDTVYSYRSQAGRWRRRWGHLPLRDLNRAELEAWRLERLGEVKPRTVKGERSVLMSFLRWCEREGLISSVPRVDAVKGVPKKRARPAALDPSEVETLLKVARSAAQPQVRALEAVVMLGAFAGLRRAEICALEWGDIAGDVLTVRPHGAFSPKGYEQREVPIGARLGGYLRKLRKQRGDARWVAETAERGRWVVGSLTRWARRLWVTAELHDDGLPVLHGLRHHFGSQLVAQGTDVETVRALMGHSSVTTTEVYLHSTLDRKRAAVAGL